MERYWDQQIVIRVINNKVTMKPKMDRRNFLKISAIGGASTVVASCDKDPVESLIPLLVPPHDYFPGVSIHFATTCQACSANCGLIIRTREGRAVKAEGNPYHPLNEGKICVQGQAILQELYSPSRARGPILRGKDRQQSMTWVEAKSLLGDQIKKLNQQVGKKVLYLGPPRTGAFPKMMVDWLEAMGGGDYLAFDMTPANSLRKANQITFGRDEIPHFAIDKAELLLNFGADFLESWLNPVQLARSYDKMHRYQDGKKGKYIHCAPHMSLTGTNADEWIPCRTGDELLVALTLSRLILEKAEHISPNEKKRLQIYLNDFTVASTARKTGISIERLNKLADEFGRVGKSLALAGGTCNAGKTATHLHIAVDILNYIAGNIGKTVVFGADYQIGGDSMAELDKAIAAMNSGQYAMVIIENVNPVFALPGSSGFKKALKNVPLVISLSTEEDETSTLAQYHFPVAHFLESWGDAKPRNGVYSLQQPAMAKIPAFNTMDLGDLLIQLAQEAGLDLFAQSNYRDYLQESWKTVHQDHRMKQPFEQFWKESLQRGGYFEDFDPVPISSITGEVFSATPILSKETDHGLTLMAVNSSLHNANGKGGNKSWLLEIPHPVTQVVWDSWLEIHPETATRLGIKHGDLVGVSSQSGSVEVAAWVYYGIEKGTVAMPAGLGRHVLFPDYKSSRGRAKFLPVLEARPESKIKPTKAGINVMDLVSWQQDSLSGDLAFAAEKVQIKPTGKAAFLVSMDGQFRDDIASDKTVEDPTGFGDRSQKGRELIQTISLKHSDGHDEDANHEHHLRPRHYTLSRKDKHSLYDPMTENVKSYSPMAGKQTPAYHDPHKWEMVIDLDRCIGCSACVAACYAENNIPLVGKERVAMGREMSWLRIERYIEKNKTTNQFEIYYSPQMCQQCDNAGCEPVCPVYATYQTPDGLNAMVYNRCVGTRYCSNNCAFKQRRFNWRSYQFPTPLHMQLNPAVTVRSKGVMEKCTFCQHRIREMKDLAKDQGRDVRDGEIMTACQQACPVDAISFGNIKDKNSIVSQLKTQSKRGYTQLPELNYKPAVTYLKKVNHENRKA